MNYIDKFLYKLFILMGGLLLVVVLDYFEIVAYDNIKYHMSDHINTIKIIKAFNGKLKLIDLDEEVEVVSNYQKSQNILENGKIIAKRYYVDEYSPVYNIGVGNVVKIEKNKEMYKVYIQYENEMYCYEHLQSLNIQLYQLVKVNEIIGLPKNNYYDVYRIDHNVIIPYEN